MTIKINNKKVVKELRKMFSDEDDMVLVTKFVGRNFSANGEIIMASVILHAAEVGKPLGEILTQCEREWNRVWNLQHPAIRGDPEAPGRAGTRTRASLWNINHALGIEPLF